MSLFYLLTYFKIFLRKNVKMKELTIVRFTLRGGTGLIRRLEILRGVESLLEAFGGK